MLSFDITDRNIRVVRGVEANGKIKINSAATLNLEEGLIQNGYVRDIPNVATMINGVLKRNKMPDKEAIVSIFQLHHLQGAHSSKDKEPGYVKAGQGSDAG